MRSRAARDDCLFEKQQRQQERQIHQQKKKNKNCGDQTNNIAASAFNEQELRSDTHRNDGDGLAKGSSSSTCPPRTIQNEQHRSCTEPARVRHLSPIVPQNRSATGPETSELKDPRHVVEMERRFGSIWPGARDGIDESWSDDDTPLSSDGAEGAK
eukprot:TRINITY_DN96790_c0_g1_i1.p1 TRINITY_DN96790_c0_g1~~TRINITY_DN96790_c0_g1_i1.p1  ORF type:complete len:156 (+),score=21.83 TRINITY_DN96790_c0_g1_i1:2-469(+)